MSQPNHSYQIVVAVDLTEMTDAVLAAAAEQAARHEGSIIHALCVVDDTQDVLDRSIDHGKELNQLEQAVRVRVMAGLSENHQTIEVLARAGRPAEQILALAAEVEADLIVLGRHSQSKAAPLFLGSVPSRLLAQSRCNVLVVQPKTYNQ